MNDTEDTEDSICPSCNGSGEGFADRTRCSSCGGSGCEPTEEQREAREDFEEMRAEYRAEYGRSTI